MRPERISGLPATGPAMSAERSFTSSQAETKKAGACMDAPAFLNSTARTLCGPHEARAEISRGGAQHDPEEQAGDGHGHHEIVGQASGNGRIEALGLRSADHVRSGDQQN